MTIAGYFYQVEDPKQLPKLMAGFAKCLNEMSGSPLRPVSSVGGVIDIASYKDAATNLEALERVVAATHARREAVDEQRFTLLMRAREREDLPVKADHRVLKAGRAKAGRYDWHLVETRTVDAWKMFEDSRGGIRWDGISVGQIDTGFTEHPVFGFGPGGGSWLDTRHDYNYMALQGDAYTEAGSNFPFNETVDNATDPLGGAHGGHGTRTGSVLSGYSDKEGYRGAAPQIPVVPIRLLDSVWLDGVLATHLPDAIVRLVDKAQVRMITLSMGAPHPFPILSPVHFPPPKELRAAIDYAYEKGVFVICAAGNNIPNPDVVYPARLNRTIAVAGSSPNAMPWSGSSRGSEVDITAPANGVQYANRLRNGKDVYGQGDGTSYATPQVCAAAALWLAWHGDAIKAAYPLPWQPIEAFRNLIKSTASPLAGDPAFWKGRWGAGLLDCEALLKAALPAAGSLTEADRA